MIPLFNLQQHLEALIALRGKLRNAPPEVKNRNELDIAVVSELIEYRKKEGI